MSQVLLETLIFPVFKCLTNVNENNGNENKKCFTNVCVLKIYCGLRVMHVNYV